MYDWMNKTSERYQKRFTVFDWMNVCYKMYDAEANKSKYIYISSILHVRARCALKRRERKIVTEKESIEHSLTLAFLSDSSSSPLLSTSPSSSMCCRIRLGIGAKRIYWLHLRDTRLDYVFRFICSMAWAKWIDGGTVGTYSYAYLCICCVIMRLRKYAEKKPSFKNSIIIKMRR